MKKFYLISIVVLGFCLFVNAQTISKTDKQLSFKLDTMLSKLFKPNEPGCAILIARKGQVIYKKAFGIADLELNIPNNPDMIFEIGSISKQFTAVAIMQLVEQGKISLQDPINKFIEDYPMNGYQITIEHLLTHTSGLKDIFKIKGFDSTFWRRDYTPIEYMNFFKKENMEFAPGTKFNYCNTGFILLGYIIEKVSGLTYQQYIEDNIFKRADMSNSYYGSYYKIIKNRSKGYSKIEGTNIFGNLEQVSWTIVGGAGALMCNTEDFFKYYQALNSYKLLKKENLEKTRTSYKLANGNETGYGYGIGTGNIQGSPLVSHTGGITGYFTSQMYFLNEDVNIILFTNCENYMSIDPTFKIASLVIEK
jgi:CubicO group peptidase (beta-lactamase class C family)